MDNGDLITDENRARITRVLESKIKSYVSPRILHIATHGFFLANQDYDPNKIGISALLK